MKEEKRAMKPKKPSKTLHIGSRYDAVVPYASATLRT